MDQKPDYLDELIEENVRSDPKFAAHWQEAEARLDLAMMRQRAGLTQAEVAAAMQVTQPRVVEIEKDPMKVSFGRLKRYVEAVGGTIEFHPRP